MHGGAAWRILTGIKQIWCCLQVTLCDSYLSALETFVKTRYFTDRRYLYLYLYLYLYYYYYYYYYVLAFSQPLYWTIAKQRSAIVIICRLSVCLLRRECIVTKRLKLETRDFTEKYLNA